MERGLAASSALDMAKDALEPYDRFNITWRHSGERFGAAIVVDIRGIAITYHDCDPVGRFRNPLLSERANFAPVALRFGVRRFLLCPGCQGRRRILYGGGELIRCRVCLDLRYASQNMGEVDRIWKQINKINRRVDPAAGLLDINEFPEKPKRMRWKTYERLEERHAAQGERLCLHLLRRLGLAPSSAAAAPR